MNIMMIDTETTNSIEDPIAYDVGFQIFDENGSVLDEASMVNSDIFLDKEMMENAYFADKIPQYWDEIKMGARDLMSWYSIKQRLYGAYSYHNCEAVCAHNARFDYRALHLTQRYITTSKFRFVLPWGAEWLDTLKMARAVLKDDTDYSKYCNDNGYITCWGQPRFTAEILYRYITGKEDFEEKHTALEDVRIEKLIYFYCLSRNPDVDGRLWAPKITD
jgi:hypothetical protein